MYACVLSDRSTWDALEGSYVADVPDDVEMDDVEEWFRLNPTRLVPFNALEHVKLVEFNGDVLVAPDMNEDP